MGALTAREDRVMAWHYDRVQSMCFSMRFDLTTQHERVTAFHRLHSSGCFVMPNPWDVGSARALNMGFKALATTSAGFAWTLGRADNHVTLDQTLEHLRAVADAVDVPVNADFEGGFAVDPEQVQREREARRRHGRRRDLDRGLHG